MTNPQGPKSASAYKEEGNDFFKNGKYADALSAYTAAIKVDNEI